MGQYFEMKNSYMYQEKDIKIYDKVHGLMKSCKLPQQFGHNEKPTFSQTAR